jgi:hypothetical protein
MGFSFNEITTRELVGLNLHVINMASTELATEVVLPAELPEGLPVLSDPKVVFLGGPRGRPNAPFSARGTLIKSFRSDPAVLRPHAPQGLGPLFLAGAVCSSTRVVECA